MIRGLVGQLSLSDTIGLGPIETMTLMADGSLEPLDVLRIAGNGSTASKTHVRSNAIKEVQNDPVWERSLRGQHQLCETCQIASIWMPAAAAIWRSAGRANAGSTIRASIARAGSAFSAIFGPGSRPH